MKIFFSGDAEWSSNLKSKRLKSNIFGPNSEKIKKNYPQLTQATPYTVLSSLP